MVALHIHPAKLKHLTTIIQRMLEQARWARYDPRASRQRMLLAGGRRMSALHIHPAKLKHLSTVIQ
jgi:hypothetical protein